LTDYDLKLALHLSPPLSFYTTPPSSLAPRHRNRHPQSHLAIDSSGREHLLLHFWVSSSPSTHDEPAQTWQEWFNDLSWDQDSMNENYEHAKRTLRIAWDNVKGALAFISGQSSAASPSLPSNTKGIGSLPTPTVHQEEREGSGWSFFGMFKSIKIGGNNRNDKDSGSSASALSGIKWDSGEVHVDFVKVSCVYVT
jgi:mitochondrial import inner membrane translocase subunit TIM21